MDKDKKQQVDIEELVNDFTILADFKRPPYRVREFEGVVVKTYPFIRGNSKIYNQQIPEKEFSKKDYSLSAAYKKELENQLELNRKYCIGQYNHIILTTENWLRGKFDSQKVDKDAYKQITNIFPAFSKFMNDVKSGAEIETIKEDLQDKDSFQLKTTIQGVVFDINELIEKAEFMLDNIERVVSRSVDQYFEYVNVHSRLYDFDAEKFLSDEGQKRWDRLSNEKQNKIMGFLSGKRKKNKPYYKFILAILELNWDRLKDVDNTAVIDVAKNKSEFEDFIDKPTIKPQTKLIQQYKIDRQK